MEILDDPERESAANLFLRLEVLPQAIFNNREAEARAQLAGVDLGEKEGALE
jgi:hypothetical protein